MKMNKNVLSFTWSVLRLSSLCGLALTLTGMAQATKAKACYACVSVEHGSFFVCQTSANPYTTCIGGRSCTVGGVCGVSK